MLFIDSEQWRYCMSKILKIRPGKFQSIIGFIAGCIFCLIGIFVVIPRAGLFGYIWTIFAVLITITTGMNAFSKHGIATQTVEIENGLEDVDLSNFYTQSEVEERLIQLKELHEKELITDEEYAAKKAQVLKRL